MDVDVTCQPRSDLVEDVGLVKPSKKTLDGMSRFTHELNFWDSFLASQGGKWAGDFNRRVDPSTQVEGFMRSKIPDNAQVLDVGAGPLTVIGKWCGNQKISITAVDPLAQHYDELLAKHGIVPLVRTILGYGESLHDQFGSDRFDYVHAQNSVDHSEDPLSVIFEMISVARPGCWITLLHHRNEGVKQDYTGMHGWNFDKSGDDFVLWKTEQFHNVTHKVRHMAECNVSIMGDDLVFAEIRKKKGGEVK